MKLARTLCALLLLAPLAGSVFVEVRAEEDDEPGQRTMPFAVRDTSAARYAVRETRRLLEDGRTTQGLRLAQEILDDLPADFCRVPGSEASTRWRLAVEEIRDLLAALPESGRATYDRLVRAATEPIVARALESRRAEELASVVDRYGASRAGIDASRLLADLALEEGRGRDAALWARRGLRFAPRDAGLWMRVVDALGAERDGAALAALELPEDVAGQQAADGSGRTLEAHLDAWRRHVPKPSAPPGWTIWGGTPGRAAHATATGPRPDSLRWRTVVPYPGGVLDRDHYRLGWRGGIEQAFADAWDRLRPFHPVVEQRTVYVADGRCVRALDLYSGRPHWVFDWESPTPPAIDLLQPQAPSQGRTPLERAFSPVLDEDLVLATVEVRRPYERETLQLVEISTYLPHRLLVALDRRSGSLRWYMGEHAADRDVLAELTIVSPCVVSEGLAVAVAARNEGGFHRVSLVALDVETGRVRWHRTVGWGNQELNLFGASVKELAATAPAVDAGVVYASTGLGFVAAVELRTGRPRWLASYEIQPIKPVQLWYEAPLRFPMVAPSPAIVWKDLVLIAPTDGKHLHAFDRRDGRLRWRAPYPKRARVGAPAQFLGVANDGRRDVALITGADLVAFDIDTGKPVWVGHLQDEHGTRNVPIGRGAIANGHVLVPTNRGLVRFSLVREGSFEGRDPWPNHVVPGNVLPLPRLLLVSGRDALQAFYSWDEIEQDIARRRRSLPDDPSVLLEAGEIYRLGGALDRAKRTFREALAVAEQGEGDPEAEKRAARGLYRTWRSFADEARATDPARARAALAQALEWARTPRERVEARIVLDGLLEALLEARAENLEGLVVDGAGVRAAFSGDTEDVPARAMALLKLAQVRTEQGEPAKAVAALQRLLTDEGDVEIRGTPARELARAYIDEITRVWGREPYQPYEDAAKRLLAQAQGVGGTDALGAGATDVLDRILREYPNATVVPTALLALGERRLAEGETLLATEILRRFLGDYGDDPGVPRGAALLARGYDRLGLEGARRFAWAWLERRHPDAAFVFEGKEVTGALLAAAERRPPRTELPPGPLALTTPLREVHFESVGNDAWGRQVIVETVDGGPAPVSLLTDGRSIVAFDLVRAEVAFRLDPGPCQRAFHHDGVLVLALSRSLMGVAADTGQELWNLPVEGNVQDLEGAGGLVFALLDDSRGRGGSRRLVALDEARGHVVWRLPLGRQDDFRDLRVHGGDALLRQSRYRAGSMVPSLLVVDGLIGRVRQIVNMPPESRTEIEPIVVERRLVVAARDQAGARHVSAHDLDSGSLVWTRPLPGRSRVCTLAACERGVVVLQADGSLGTYLLEDGAPLDLTRIFAGTGADACPFHGTSGLPAEDRLILMPRIASPPATLGAWALDTGKLLWQSSWDERRSPSRSSLVPVDDAVIALTPFTPPRAPPRVLLRIIALADGNVKQEIEPVGLTAEFGLLSVARGWGTVVVFGRSGAVVYASTRR